MAEIWQMLSDFITSMFTAFGSIIQSATGSIIGVWLIVVPLFGLAITYVGRLVHAGSGKKKKGK